MYSATGGGNTALGYLAGRRGADGVIVNASCTNSVLIGSESRVNNTGQTNQIVIGHQAIGNGSNTTTIGNSSTTGTFIPAGNLTVSNGTLNVKSTSGTGTFNIIASDNDSMTFEAGTTFNQILTFNNNNPFYISAGSADLILRTAINQTRMTVLNSGNVSIANGNLVMSTAGTGIDFSATTNSSGTMTSELLSDYEEGTFTPTVSSGVTSPTYSQQTGWYTKVGRMVYFMIRINLSSGTANANHYKFGGLPFTSNAGALTTAGAHWTFSQNFLAANTSALPNPYISSSSTTVDLYNLAGLAFVGTDANSITSPITIQGFYYV
jgi:hypothetical protein